jgi:hypothetical protein
MNGGNSTGAATGVRKGRTMASAQDVRREMFSRGVLKLRNPAREGQPMQPIAFQPFDYLPIFVLGRKSCTHVRHPCG